jgi:hypothetical protein
MTHREMEDEEEQPQGLLDDALVGHGVQVEESTGEMRFSAVGDFFSYVNLVGGVTKEGCTDAVRY